jgi:integrase
VSAGLERGGDRSTGPAEGPGRAVSGASRLDAGENIKALAEYLGHSGSGLTLRVYAHLMPSSQERTRKAVAAVFGTARSGPPST